MAKNMLKHIENGKESDLQIVYRDPKELKLAEYNPRKISPKQREDIKISIRDFGFQQPIVVNKNPEREDVIIGGNQRVRIAIEMGIERVPTVEVHLSLEKEKNLNLRLNKNTGEFDQVLLQLHFDRELLLETGWTDKEIGRLITDVEERLNAITNSEAVMPIVPKYSEKYTSVIIFCRNELDFNWMRNVLNLNRRRDYKNTRIGETHVIDVTDFQKVWENNAKT